MGTLYGVASSPAREEAQLSNLEQQINVFERAVAEGEPFTPYSEQVLHHQKIEHNSISRFGQNMGGLFKTLVRELLRSFVRFFDGILSY